MCNNFPEELNYIVRNLSDRRSITTVTEGINAYLAVYKRETRVNLFIDFRREQRRRIGRIFIKRYERY